VPQTEGAPNGAPPYGDLERAWKALRPHGFYVREVACAGVARTLLVADIAARGEASAPAVIVTAGVHGDEQAAPWALLSLARDGLLDHTFAYRLWPCTNPTGYVLGTRENAEGIDINRSYGRGGTSPEARAMIGENGDRKFVLNLDLHEDFEADGFYCYEPDVDELAFGPAIVQAIDDAGLPVQDLEHGYELGYPPNARHYRLERGRVIPNVAAELAFLPKMPHSISLLRRGVAARSLTFESPRCRPWDDRIATHRIAVVTALERLRSTL
jgi:protein MpaA